MAAVVTGGASGLGQATARMLARNGAKVAIFDLNDSGGAVTAEEIRGIYVGVDVSDDASVTVGLATAESAHGTARILVNCAGVAPACKTVGKDLAPHSYDVFARTIAINLIGTFSVASKFAARAAAADIIDEDRAVIINTASVAAYEAQMGQTAYGASKGGVVGLTLPMARDLAGHRIRVVSIAPGVFLTPMVASFPQHVQDALGAQVPHPSRLGRPEEYAQLAEAIITNPMINGETIRIDGAIRMPPR